MHARWEAWLQINAFEIHCFLGISFLTASTSKNMSKEVREEIYGVWGICIN